MSKKIGFVNALIGALIINIFTAPLGALGMSEHIWLVFTALILFFALGGNKKNIPTMILSFICGVFWWTICLYVAQLLPVPISAAMSIGSSLGILAILFVHECLLKPTILGTVPAVFLGFSLTSYSYNPVAEGVMQLNQLHVIGLFILGIVATVVLMTVSFGACRLIFGMEKTIAHFTFFNHD